MLLPLSSDYHCIILCCYILGPTLHGMIEVLVQPINLSNCHIKPFLILILTLKAVNYFNTFIK